jgi:membrane fusion protein (multidrug efflux system)
LHQLSGRWKIVVWVLGLTTVILAAGAFTAFDLLRTSQDSARIAALPIPVQALPVTVRSLDDIIGASGSIEPSMPISVTSGVVARVLRVLVDDGSIVRPGDLLVEFDQKLYAANLASARANYAHAHQQLLRLEALGRKDFAAPTDIETARVADAQAYDALVSAQIDLDNTAVRSPVAGVVLSRSVNPGETSRAQEVLMQLGVLDPVVMEAAVPEDKIRYLSIGMQGQVATDAFPGKVFVGSVSKIDSAVNPATRTIVAYIQLDNHDLSLRKGVTGYARLLSHRIVLAAPSTSIMNPVGDQATVFVVDKARRAHLRRVEIGLSNNGLTEILSGLAEGEQVVAAGQFGLRDNDLVRANQSAPWNRS